MLSTGNFMRPPDDEQVYEIGDRVEVNCDHEDKDGQRIRGWVRGTVVQIENKLVAVQFKDKIYLTDGWMIPDHILWFPFDSENVRPWVSPQSRARKKG